LRAYKLVFRGFLLLVDLARAHEYSLAQKSEDIVENARASQTLAATSRHVDTAAATLVTLGAGVLLCCNDRCKKPRMLGVCPKTQRPWQACSKECFEAQESVDAMRDLERVEAMAGGSPITEEDFPSLALPARGQRKRAREYAYSLHDSGTGKGTGEGAKGAAKGKGKGWDRAKGKGKGGAGAGRGR
jgi:hypothetical protein